MSKFISDVYPVHVYIFEEKDGTDVGIFNALNVGAENVEDYKRFAEQYGYLYNVIQNGIIVDTNRK